MQGGEVVVIVSHEYVFSTKGELVFASPAFTTIPVFQPGDIEYTDPSASRPIVARRVVSSTATTPSHLSLTSTAAPALFSIDSYAHVSTSTHTVPVYTSTPVTTYSFTAASGGYAEWALPKPWEIQRVFIRPGLPALDIEVEPPREREGARVVRGADDVASVYGWLIQTFNEYRKVASDLGDLVSLPPLHEPSGNRPVVVLYGDLAVVLGENRSVVGVYVVRDPSDVEEVKKRHGAADAYGVYALTASLAQLIAGLIALLKRLAGDVSELVETWRKLGGREADSYRKYAESLREELNVLEDELSRALDAEPYAAILMLRSAMGRARWIWSQLRGLAWVIGYTNPRALTITAVLEAVASDTELAAQSEIQREIRRPAASRERIDELYALLRHAHHARYIAEFIRAVQEFNVYAESRGGFRVLMSGEYDVKAAWAAREIHASEQAKRVIESRVFRALVSLLEHWPELSKNNALLEQLGLRDFDEARELAARAILGDVTWDDVDKLFKILSLYDMLLVETGRLSDMRDLRPELMPIERRLEASIRTCRGGSEECRDESIYLKDLFISLRFRGARSISLSQGVGIWETLGAIAEALDIGTHIYNFAKPLVENIIITVGGWMGKKEEMRSAAEHVGHIAGLLSAVIGEAALTAGLIAAAALTGGKTLPLAAMKAFKVYNLIQLASGALSFASKMHSTFDTDLERRMIIERGNLAPLVAGVGTSLALAVLASKYISPKVAGKAAKYMIKGAGSFFDALAGAAEKLRYFDIAAKFRDIARSYRALAPGVAIPARLVRVDDVEEVRVRNAVDLAGRRQLVVEMKLKGEFAGSIKMSMPENLRGFVETGDFASAVATSINKYGFRNMDELNRFLGELSDALEAVKAKGIEETHAYRFLKSLVDRAPVGDAGFLKKVTYALRRLDPKTVRSIVVDQAYVVVPGNILAGFMDAADDVSLTLRYGEGGVEVTDATRAVLRNWASELGVVFIARRDAVDRYAELLDKYLNNRIGLVEFAEKARELAVLNGDMLVYLGKALYNRIHGGRLLLVKGHGAGEYTYLEWSPGGELTTVIREAPADASTAFRELNKSLSGFIRDLNGRLGAIKRLLAAISEGREHSEALGDLGLYSLRYSPGDRSVTIRVNPARVKIGVGQHAAPAAEFARSIRNLSTMLNWRLVVDEVIRSVESGEEAVIPLDFNAVYVLRVKGGKADVYFSLEDRVVKSFNLDKPTVEALKNIITLSDRLSPMMPRGDAIDAVAKAVTRAGSPAYVETAVLRYDAANGTVVVEPAKPIYVHVVNLDAVKGMRRLVDELGRSLSRGAVEGAKPLLSTIDVVDELYRLAATSEGRSALAAYSALRGELVVLVNEPAKRLDVLREVLDAAVSGKQYVRVLDEKGQVALRYDPGQRALFIDLGAAKLRELKLPLPRDAFASAIDLYEYIHRAASPGLAQGVLSQLHDAALKGKAVDIPLDYQGHYRLIFDGVGDVKVVRSTDGQVVRRYNASGFIRHIDRVDEIMRELAALGVTARDIVDVVNAGRALGLEHARLIYNPGSNSIELHSVKASRAIRLDLGPDPRRVRDLVLEMAQSAEISPRAASLFTEASTLLPSAPGLPVAPGVRVVDDYAEVQRAVRDVAAMSAFAAGELLGAIPARGGYSAIGASAKGKSAVLIYSRAAGLGGEYDTYVETVMAVSTGKARMKSREVVGARGEVYLRFTVSSRIEGEPRLVDIDPSGVRDIDLLLTSLRGTSPELRNAVLLSHAVNRAMSELRAGTVPVSIGSISAVDVEGARGLGVSVYIPAALAKSFDEALRSIDPKALRKLAEALAQVYNVDADAAYSALSKHISSVVMQASPISPTPVSVTQSVAVYTPQPPRRVQKERSHVVTGGERGFMEAGEFTEPRTFVEPLRVTREDVKIMHVDRGLVERVVHFETPVESTRSEVGEMPVMVVETVVDVEVGAESTSPVEEVAPAALPSMHIHRYRPVEGPEEARKKRKKEEIDRGIRVVGEVVAV